MSLDYCTGLRSIRSPRLPPIPRLIRRAHRYNGTQPAMTDPTLPDDPILDRLEDQLTWYSQKSRAARRAFKRIKVTEIIAAALIPALTGHTWPRYPTLLPYVIGALGVIITILEGLLHLNQYQDHWTTYRATAESLKHEKFLYLAKAGPYATAADPRVTLAERVESTVSQENSQWLSTLQKSSQSKSS